MSWRWLPSWRHKGPCLSTHFLKVGVSKRLVFQTTRYQETVVKRIFQNLSDCDTEWWCHWTSTEVNSGSFFRNKRCFSYHARKSTVSIFTWLRRHSVHTWEFTFSENAGFSVTRSIHIGFVLTTAAYIRMSLSHRRTNVDIICVLGWLLKPPGAVILGQTDTFCVSFQKQKCL